MMKLLSGTVLSFLALTASYAQTAVKGKVIDAGTGQPVSGATVSALQNGSNTMTDNHGNFTINTNSEQDSILCTSIGYAAKKLVASGDLLVVLLSPSFASLNEIVVTAGREVQRRTEVPVAISVISKTTINDTKATRLDMLLNKVPGVFMVDLGNEQHSMSVRQPLGYKNLFLYLEDGIPIRTVGDFNHNALIEINQASLERMEVVKGPASALYGSEAVGGAVNFLTQSPSPFLTGKIQAEGSSRGYKRTDFSLSNTDKKLGFFIGGYDAKQDQPENEHNDFRKTAVTLRLDYTFSDQLKLVTVADFIWYKTDQKGGLDSAHFYNRDYLSLYRFTCRQVDAWRLRSTLTKDWNGNNKTSLTVFHRNSTIGQIPFYYISNIAANPMKAKGQINEDGFKSYGSVLQHRAKWKSINAQLISGISIDVSPATYEATFIDIHRDANKVYNSYTIKDSLLTNYSVDLLNTAAYTQMEYKPATRLKIVAAARYDRLDYKFDNHLTPGAYTGAPDETNHFSHFTPKLGMTWDFGKNRGAYINYSVGFAPPNISDLYTGVKVPVLKASSYHNYELGGWVSFAANKGYTELSLYKLDGTNEIVSERLADGTYQNQNAGKTSHKGIEANVRYSPAEDIAIRLSGTYAKHKYIEYTERGKDYAGRTMAQAPQVMYNGEVTYKPHYCKGFRLAVEVQGMNKYYTDPQNTATYNGFTVCNARTGYTIKGFEVWLNCLNITNKVFATTVEKNAYGSAYRPGQLRTFHLGFAYNFSKQ